MPRQLLVSLFLLLSAACGKPAVAPAGLKFEQHTLDLGRLISGEEVEVEFPFSTLSAVRVDRLSGSCGCLYPRIELSDGGESCLGVPLESGANGAIVAGFATAGLLGQREVTLDVLGEGPGLPARLAIRAELEPWFDVSPSPLHFGSVSGEKEEIRIVRVVGPEPFRITEILTGGPPLQIEGVPSPVSLKEQEIKIVLPPSREEGRHRRALRFLADNGYSFILQSEFSVEGDLWTRPGKRLLLGGIPSSVPTYASVEVGVRIGELPIPKVRLEGIPGATTDCVTLRADNRYRVQLTLPSNLPKGPLTGTLRLELHPRSGSMESIVYREIQIIGGVQ